MKLGDKVRCSAYIKKSGFYYDTGIALDRHYCCCVTAPDVDPEEVEDYHSCERFKMVEKEFTGVYVGTTTINTRLAAEYYDDTYRTGYRTFTEEPKKFCVVYFKENQKRIVPIDRIEVVSDVETR